MVRTRAPRTMRRNISPGLQMHLAVAASLPNASEDGGALTRGPGGGGQVLVGDAAHAMPPFLGQGANQAIQDAYALARALAEADTVAAALAQYQRARLPPTAQVRCPPPLPARRRSGRARDKGRRHCAQLTAKSVLLGRLETASGPGARARDLLFAALARAGVAPKVSLDGAAVRV